MQIISYSQGLTTQPWTSEIDPSPYYVKILINRNTLDCDRL